MKKCIFCALVRGEEQAAKIYEDDQVLVFLDKRPLFHGHCLLIPKQHHETLGELPIELLQICFVKVKKFARIVEEAMAAEGSFVAMNNKVSQSVPHFHVHIVPRKRGDGLKGFFWPRTTYNETSLTETIYKLQSTLKKYIPTPLQDAK